MLLYKVMNSLISTLHPGVWFDLVPINRNILTFFFKGGHRGVPGQFYGGTDPCWPPLEPHLRAGILMLIMSLPFETKALVWPTFPAKGTLFFLSWKNEGYSNIDFISEKRFFHHKYCISLRLLGEKRKGLDVNCFNTCYTVNWKTFSCTTAL